jgi:hypothetical protein
MLIGATTDSVGYCLYWEILYSGSGLTSVWIVTTAGYPAQGPRGVRPQPDALGVLGLTSGQSTPHLDTLRPVRTASS